MTWAAIHALSAPRKPHRKPAGLGARLGSGVARCGHSLSSQLAAAFVASTGARARDVLKAPQLSPAAITEQTIGLTEITIAYHRPAVHRRAIWGEIVPYGEVLAHRCQREHDDPVLEPVKN